MTVEHVNKALKNLLEEEKLNLEKSQDLLIDLGSPLKNSDNPDTSKRKEDTFDGMLGEITQTIYSLQDYATYQRNVIRELHASVRQPVSLDGLVSDLGMIPVK